MNFSVTILGSNSAIPSLSRNPSAQWLNAAERIFLIDCAEGTQLQLRRFHLHFQRIKHILISHLHGDHYYGLMGLLTTFHLLGRKEILHLYGPPELSDIVNLQLEVSLTRLLYPLEFHPLVSAEPEMIFTDERVEVTAFPLLHSIPTYGFLFREKIRLRNYPACRSYAYCSDTAYDESIIPLIKGVDLVYHEATFHTELQEQARNRLHSTAAEAATIALKCGAGKLLIGHFSARYDSIQPLLDEARAVFPETIAASDGETIQIFSKH